MIAYEKKIKDIFIDHHTDMGMDSAEAEDLYNESSFRAVEKWLAKNGYAHEIIL